MLIAVVRLCQTIVAKGLKWFEQRLQQLTQPSTISTIMGAVTDFNRSKSELVVENALVGSKNPTTGVRLPNRNRE